MGNQNNTSNPSDSDNGFTSKDVVKVIIAGTVSLISLAFTILICFVIYHNGLTADSILSMLLAFFSIFISIFFYFKADETSSRFYDSSYEFMKEQSELLGRIEERFGEKFENLFSRIDHLDAGQAEKESELHTKTEEISDIISKLVQTISSYKQPEKTEELLEEIQKYGTELVEKKAEYNQLVENLQEMRQEALEASSYVKALQTVLPNSVSEDMLRFFAELTNKELNYLLRCGGKIQSSNRTYRLAKSYGLCNEKGQLSPELKKALDTVRHKNNYFY